MSFRQSGQSDERRRRVLREDREAGAGPEGGPHGGVKEAGAKEGAPRRSSRPKASARRAYTAAALVEGQLRLIDLIPVRAWALLVLVLLVLTAISALDVLYLQWPKWGRAFSSRDLAFFDLSARDSLGGWFSAMLLAVAACQCLFIYCLRRYRADDYRGRYRIWLTMGCVFLLASADAVAGLGRALTGMAAQFSQIGDVISPLWFGRAVWAAIFVLGTVRMTFEMRRSASSVTWLSLGAACYATMLLLLAPALTIPSTELSVLARSTCLLVGHACMLFTAMCYARRVFLEAHGEIAMPGAAGKKKKRKTASSKKGAAATSRSGGDDKKEVVAPTAPVKPAVETKPSPAAPSPAKTESKPIAAAAAAAAAPAAKSEAPAPVKISPLAKLLGGRKAPAAEAPSSPPAKAPSSPAPSRPASTPVFKAIGKDDDDEDDDDDTGEGEGDQKLSKAERRRLRKEQRRDRRAA